MKASVVVRQVVLDRRSNVTQRLNRELVVGKHVIHVLVVNPCSLFLTTFDDYHCDTGIEHLHLKKLGQSIPDDEFFKKHPSYNPRVLDGLMSILQLLGSTGDPTFDEESYDPSEVITIIRSTTINAMECFVSFASST
jgi:hypothetical protein